MVFKPSPKDSLRTLKAKQQEEWADKVSELMEAGLLKNDRVYIGQSDTHRAYAYVLDTGEKATPALEYVAIETNKPDTWVDNVKHSPIGKQMLNRVIKSNESHPVAAQMKDNNILTRTGKRAIKESRTVSSVLNTLSDLVGLNDRIEQLETDVSTLQNAVETLVIHAGQTEDRLDTIEHSLTKLSKSDMKRKAKELSGAGFNQEEIGAKLGKSGVTIGRWLKEK